MDIPAIRFLLPSFVLFAFYWNFVSNPFLDENPDQDSDAAIEVMRFEKLARSTQDLLAQHRYTEALAPSLELHKVFPENAVYIEQLAHIYQNQGNFEAEAAMWEKYLTYAPLPADGCPQIGVAYLKQDKESEAYGAFQRCVSLEAKSDSLLYLALVLERRGKSKEADELYGKALLRAPDYTDVLIGKARCEARLGHAGAARTRMLDVLGRQPDNADALLAMGMACMRLNKRAEARKSLLHGQEIRPSDRDFASLLGRLKAKRKAAAE
jgi:tetratricopeptide (TPR) repeat protein